jgi:hypothetical protein
MVAPKYRTDARGRIQVESKDDLRKRLPGGRSPDACDAWLLSLYARRSTDYAGVAATLGDVARRALGSPTDDADDDFSRRE